MSEKSTQTGFTRSIGTWEVMVTGVALVVASSTLVSDFTGYFALGGAFVVALLLAFGINLLLGLSVADLAVAFPRAGALYAFAKATVGGSVGRFLAVVLAFTFFGTFAFVISGEITSGALALRALSGIELPIEAFILVLGVLAVIPNIFGIRTTALASAGLLLFMLGIRWFFGLAGFFGFSRTGTWLATNLDSGVGAFDLFGGDGILAAGLTLALWGFVGIEFAASLAEEVKQPRRALPRGIVLGLSGILVTSLVMGLGVVGTAPLADWRAMAAGANGIAGEAPQLAVGTAMFGAWGAALMALASVSATLGTLVVAFAAMPRLLYSVARDGYFFGSLSDTIGRLHPSRQTPTAATILTASVFLIPAFYNAAVIDWLFSGAYVWLLLYVVFHILALINCRRRTAFVDGNPGNRRFAIVPAVGILVTLVSLYYAFAGVHATYGYRAAILGLSATALAGLAFGLKHFRTAQDSNVPEHSNLSTETNQ